MTSSRRSWSIGVLVGAALMAPDSEVHAQASVAAPCELMTAQEVVAAFAGAGAPELVAKAGETQGDARGDGRCTYSLAVKGFEGLHEVERVASGGQVKVVLSTGDAAALGGAIGGCDGMGALPGIAEPLTGVADDACIIQMGAQGDLDHGYVTGVFRSGDRRGEVALQWARGPEPVKRAAAADLTRRWARKVLALPAASRGASAVSNQTILDRVRTFAAFHKYVHDVGILATGSTNIWIRRPGETVSAWAERLAAVPMLVQALNESELTPIGYLTEGIAIRRAWQASRGEATDDAPGPALVSVLRAHRAELDQLFARVPPWPGAVK